MAEVRPSRMSSWPGLLACSWAACSWLRMGLMELAMSGARLEPPVATEWNCRAARPVVGTRPVGGAPCWKKPGSGVVVGRGSGEMDMGRLWATCLGGGCSWAELEHVDTQDEGCLWGRGAGAPPGCDGEATLVVQVVVVVMVVAATERRERDEDGDGGPERREVQEERLARSESRMGVSTPEENWEGLWPAPEAEAGSANGDAPKGYLLTWEPPPFREPRGAAGGRKRAWGRWGWRVRAMATDVVAAAACSGAWMRGAQMT